MKERGYLHMTETKVERYIRVLTNAVGFVEAQNKEEGKDYFVQISPAATREIIEILKNSMKEQDAVKPIGGYGYYICGVCKNPFNSVSQKFCSECGRKVKLDD